MVDGLVDHVIGALREYSEVRSPVSLVLLGVVVLVFLGEAFALMMLAVDSIEVFASGLFGVHPVIAWVLAPVLHRGVAHFLASVLGIVLVGFSMERHWSQDRFILVVVLTGYVSVAAGAAVLMLFSKRQTAFYGASGIVYMLAGYALTHMLTSHPDYRRIEWVSVLIGVAAVVDVLRDVMTGPFFEPHWFNGAHLSGLVIGILIGSIGLGRCRHLTESGL